MIMNNFVNLLGADKESEDYIYYIENKLDDDNDNITNIFYKP